jgi:NAD(P)-dependent dehydrogenase (short-subunit alcohol dehydrogenase family)
MNNIELPGQVAVISGGTGGIGFATARRLSKAGATVVLWDINQQALADAAVALPGVRTMQVDMLDDKAVAARTAEVTEEYGRIDILVNCIGIEARRASVIDYDVAEWRRLVDINLTATFIACKFVVRAMQERDYGRVVTISSTAGKDGNAFDAAYSSAKAGIMGFTKCLGKELATTGIRVNCVCPAAIDSPLFSRLPPEQQQFSIGKIPMGRLGKVDEVAAMIAWLCTEECSFSTGATFDVSGGRSTY